MGPVDTKATALLKALTRHGGVRTEDARREWSVVNHHSLRYLCTGDKPNDICGHFAMGFRMAQNIGSLAKRLENSKDSAAWAEKVVLAASDEPVTSDAYEAAGKVAP